MSAFAKILPRTLDAAPPRGGRTGADISRARPDRGNRDTGVVVAPLVTAIERLLG